ncbi:MAG: diguanylate cyclase, partial [Phaeospirillum sp.]|nr:diguanylate cyclase [Phaeospirillum sp.]
RTEELEAALRDNENTSRILRESEAKFHGLVNQSLVGIVVVEDGKFSYSNAKFNEIFGYSAEEMRQLGPLDVTIEPDRPLVAESFRKLFSGEVDRVALTVGGLRKNGAEVDIEVHRSVMALGGKLQSIDVILDISSRRQAEQALAFKNTILATQQEVSQDAILVVDGQGKIISYSRRFINLWGLSPDVVAAGVDEPVLQQVVAQVQDPEAFLARVVHLYTHVTEESREELALKDGRILDRYSAPMTGADGTYYGRVWHFRDITERKQAEQQIRDERAFSNKLIASLPDIFCVFDSTGRFIHWNIRLRKLLGRTNAEMSQANIFSIVHEADQASVKEKIQVVFQQGEATIELRVSALCGIRDYAVTATRTETSQGVYVIAVGSDITERKCAELELQGLQAQLRDQAVHDPLTGLYNRRYLEEMFARELILAERQGHPVSLIMGDLDHFKRVNDVHGHLAGDEVLRVFGALMKRQARGSDICCRYGGEEFLLLLPGTSTEKAVERAEQLRMALAATPVTYGVAQITVTASFGVATFPRDGRTSDALIAAADAGLYAAKLAGRNRSSTSPDSPGGSTGA